MTSPIEQACPVAHQAVGWALHALEPDEELTVALHVPDCAVCQAVVRDTEELVAGLGAAVPQEDPPASLRASLVRAVAETPQAVPAEPRHDRVRTPAVPVRRAEPAPQRVDRGSRPASWLARRRMVVAAAALVAIVAVGGLAVRTAQLDQVRVQSSQALSELVDTLVPAGSKHAVLANAEGATVGAVVLDKGQRQVLTVGMPANPADHTYVLWGVVGESAPVALGTFDVNATDAKLRSVGSGAETDGYTAYAVSLEPGRAPPTAPSSVMAEGRLV